MLRRQCSVQESKHSCVHPMQVIGVIRKKCLFKNRPRAIISKPEPQTNWRQKQPVAAA